VILVNWQWAVTEVGLEAIEGATSPSINGLTPRYFFNAERLLETTERGKSTFYDWPVHMAEKTWVDVDAFNEAFEKALEYHQEQYPDAVNPTMLEASFREAHRLAKGRD